MFMNIYMRRDNEEFLKGLSGSMSGLINELLDNYRAGNGADLFPPVPSELMEVPEQFKGSKDDEEQIIKTPEQAAKVVNTKLRPIEGKFCPNGHPIPEGRTKCLGKGCKYAS